MQKAKVKKISKVVLNVLLYIFLAICILSVFMTVFSKRSNGAAEIFGYQMRVVTSDSMAKCEHTDVSGYEIKDIPVRSMVFIKLMPQDPAEADDWYRSLKVGDVLTFRYVYSTQVTITHRITSITEKDTGGFIIELAGDNKNSDNGQLYQTIDTSIQGNVNYVIGKVTGQAYVFGAVLSFLMQPTVMVLAIILPCVIIIVLEIIKIGKVFLADKNEREKEENEKKEKELEELRRKLAELEAQSNIQTPTQTEQQNDGDDKGEDKAE